MVSYIWVILREKQNYKITILKIISMKTIEEFVELFADLFDEIDTTGFTPETDFRANDEWSSLIGLSVIAMVDEEFDVALKGDDVKSSKTIQDLYNKVVEKL